MAKKPKKQRMTQSPAARARERKAELRKKLSKDKGSLPPKMAGSHCFHSGVFLGQALYAVGRAGRDFKAHPQDAKRSIKDARAGLNQASVKNLPGVKRVRESLGRIKWKTTPNKKLHNQILALTGELLKISTVVGKRCGNPLR